ncbi:MAG: MerR family transcriptional regulator [Candidatus Omnitrophica bacterium]|nr:MerR family transcriptional regulator [Candidatus Omnitrophota bacterium]
MMGTNSKLISAKEISSRYDISYPTINHYTNLGFLSVVKRKGNKRLYEEKEVLAVLDRISRLKDEGYPLRLIRNMLRKHA